MCRRASWQKVLFAFAAIKINSSHQRHWSLTVIKTQAYSKWLPIILRMLMWLIKMVCKNRQKRNCIFLGFWLFAAVSNTFIFFQLIEIDVMHMKREFVFGEIEKYSPSSVFVLGPSLQKSAASFSCVNANHFDRVIKPITVNNDFAYVCMQRVSNAL